MTGETDAGDDALGARIDVEDVVVSFGDVPVLDGVSLAVEPGEFVGLIGPNGAGKTTLLRTLSGAVSPAAGRVAVDGVDLHDRSSRASSRLVSVVPQDTTLSFSFDVRSVVEMGRYPHRSRFSGPTPTDRERVDRALERTGTVDLADRPIDAVSGGERQRVLLARALAQDAPIMLLDEPTASLDVNHQVETLELVRDLVDEGRTVVAAIHDLELAARYCDRLVALADGAVLDAGAPASVLTSETLAAAFDATAAVTSNPVTGTPTVTALAGGASERSLPDRVHVVGAGATAAAALARLDAAGVETSLGPVASDDAAAETARQLGVPAVEVEPFAPLSEAARARVARRIEAAGAVVLADVAVGAGNQLVLETLVDAPSPVVVETRPFAERNHAGERARDLYERCRRRAVEASPERVVDAVAEAANRPRPRRSSAAVESTDD
ncbi:heme ABC transporter ATP-binding protein [Salinilacihabitans rarus]|uniref:heme ABC transporter ATP-binding protein n=1 Tax=Salinilacihabitans rarus TaxID=2961596 RepID=UPI0020C87AD0|nr:heme ABC transporter ATP-binding protein [Salinilacihabitans rarus]